MRRSITVILCAAMTAALTTGTAAARAIDPAAALAKQLKSGHGVHFTTVAKFNPDAGLKIRAYGDLQFGRSRVAASNVISKVDSPLIDQFAAKYASVSDELGFDFAKLTEPYQTITIGKTSYTTGGLADEQLPEGKKWLKAPVGGPSPGLGGVAIDVLAPAQLKKLLAISEGQAYGGTVDGVPATVYWGSSRDDIELFGTITLKLNWKIWVGLYDGLIRRVASNENIVLRPEKGKPVRIQLSTDSRITGWGDKVWIYPPDPALTSGPVKPGWLAPHVPGAINLGD
jgi:hypothetical protein